MLDPRTSLYPGDLGHREGLVFKALHNSDAGSQLLRIDCEDGLQAVQQRGVSGVECIVGDSGRRTGRVPFDSGVDDERLNPFPIQRNAYASIDIALIGGRARTGMGILDKPMFVDDLLETIVVRKFKRLVRRTGRGSLALLHDDLDCAPGRNKVGDWKQLVGGPPRGCHLLFWMSCEIPGL